MSQPGQSEIIWSTERMTGSIAGWSAGGWISGSALTATIDTKPDSHLSVYIIASGSSGAPTAAKLVDGVCGVTFGAMVLPATNGVALNMYGAGLSGANVANTLGYFNVISPLAATLMVQHNTGASAWYKVIVVGR